MVASIWFWDSPSWGWSEAWAVGFLLLPSIVSFFAVRVGRKKNARFLLALINGKDERWSTSKAGYLLWTYAIAFAFLAILIHDQGQGLEDIDLNDQYLLLLGVPAGAALAAKGITQNSVDTGKLKKTDNPNATDGLEMNPVNGVGQLLSKDDGKVDLMDTQYLIFNFLLLAYFLTAFLAEPSADLPTLPKTLVALSGVAGASYIGKKALQTDP